MYYGDLVRLRALEMEDLDEILRFWNTFELREFIGVPRPMSRKAEEEWLQEAVRLGIIKPSSRN